MNRIDVTGSHETVDPHTHRPENILTIASYFGKICAVGHASDFLAKLMTPGDWISIIRRSYQCYGNILVCRSQTLVIVVVSLQDGVTPAIHQGVFLWVAFEILGSE